MMELRKSSLEPERRCSWEAPMYTVLSRGTFSDECVPRDPVHLLRCSHLASLGTVQYQCRGVKPKPNTTNAAFRAAESAASLLPFRSLVQRYRYASDGHSAAHASDHFSIDYILMPT